tara:strand:- start:12929 stop:13279 length:351 start_codon:yes stop_codon:yes gene_type:complete
LEKKIKMEILKHHVQHMIKDKVSVNDTYFVMYENYILVYKRLQPNQIFKFLKDKNILGIANIQERYLIDHSIPICSNLKKKWHQGFIQNKHMPNKKKMAMLTIFYFDHFITDWCEF